MLPDGYATTAHNCILKDGKLSPLRNPLKVSDKLVFFENGITEIGSANTLFAWRRKTGLAFVVWPGYVVIAQSNIADDLYERIFVTGDTGFGANGDPMVYLSHKDSNSIIRHSLVKSVLDAPAVTLAEGGNADPNKTRYTYFFQTWVDSYGYESAPSGPSDEISYNDGDTINVSGLESIPQGAAKRRLYKVVAGSQNDDIQFVYEKVDNLGDELSFSLKDEDAGEILPVYESPPDDLRFMSFVPGGFYVGLSPAKRHTVMFSEVNVPTSWPMDYQYDIKDEPVGIAVTSNSVFALTNGNPWVFSGTAPESMTPSVLSTPAPCVSQRSICVFQNSVFFASHVGLMMIYNDASAGTTVRNLTEKVFTRDQWQDLNPERCMVSSHDGALHCFFVLKNGEKRGYIIDLNETISAVTTHSEGASCICNDIESGKLYFVREA